MRQANRIGLIDQEVSGSSGGIDNKKAQGSTLVPLRTINVAGRFYRDLQHSNQSRVQAYALAHKDYDHQI